MRPFKNNHVAVISLIVVSIFLGLLFARIIPELPVISDSADYHNIASGILSNKTYITISNDLILYPPLYPIFLSLIYSIAGIGSFSAVYFIQYLLVGGIALFVFLILRKFSRASLALSLIASLAILFWPYLILYSQLISSEILYSFLLILFFFLFLHINKDSKPLLAIGTGFVLGLAILTRPVALLLLPWICIAFLFLKKMPRIFGEFSIPWKKYMLVAIVMVIVLLPWEVYVKATYDRVIPIASNLSYVFKKANETMAYLSPDGVVKEEQPFLLVKAKNIYLFWNPGAGGYHLDILSQKYPAAIYGVMAYKVIFFVIIGLALISAIAYRRERLVIFSLLLITYFWALHTVLFPFPRYTLPIMPFVIIVAGVAITHGYHYYTTNTHRITGKK
jgi:4-amino-4-deoxy-L-arabinose transferase-like glycosyltransferase